MTATDWQQGLRCVACQICEKECPPKCIYIEKSKTRSPIPSASRSSIRQGLRHRYFGLHELPDLRRGLPVRRHQDGQEFELSTTTASAACCWTSRSWPSRTSITTRFIPRKRPRSTRRWPTERAKAAAKAKAAAEAKAAAAAAAAAHSNGASPSAADKPLPAASEK